MGSLTCSPCSRNALRPVCLVGRFFWSVWPSILSPINQTNQIDEIDQMNQHSFDARSKGQSWPLPSLLV